MALLVSDPSLPDLTQASTLPPGGDPAGDAAFLDWARAFCNEANRRWLDRRTGWGRDLPAKFRELVNPWRLQNHLFKWIVGWEFPSGTGPNQRHRTRFVAIQFVLRREVIEAEAARYVAELEDQTAQSIP
jgi:hypothetical protein